MIVPITVDEHTNMAIYSQNCHHGHDSSGGKNDHGNDNKLRRAATMASRIAILIKTETVNSDAHPT